MKIGIVNITTIEDVSNHAWYNQGLKLLEDNNIPYTDFISGLSSKEDLLDVFYKALRDKSVDTILFATGGNQSISFMNDIDWDLVKYSDKKYIGYSDITHFFIKAIQLQKICYYGVHLRRLVKYEENIKEILNIETGSNVQKINLLNESTNKLSTNDLIIGGHLLIFNLYYDFKSRDLSDIWIFIEYHYTKNETLEDLRYFIEVLKDKLQNNTPKGFILGNFEIYTNGIKVDHNKVNTYVCEILSSMNKPIYYIDSVKKIIKLSLCKK